jgi:hypothetical protein
VFLLSEIERQLVEIDVRRDVTDFAAVDGDLICKHAGGGDLDGIGPVVIVVAQSVGEVEDGFLGDHRSILGYIEVSGLDCTLGHAVGDKEEIELAVNDLRLLDETVVNICALGRVEDLSLRRSEGACLFEESLADSLVDDDKGHVRKRSSVLALGVVLVSQNLLELVELVLNDLLSHGIADTITIDENVVGQRASVVVTVSLEGTTEVLLENI